MSLEYIAHCRWRGAILFLGVDFEELNTYIIFAIRRRKQSANTKCRPITLMALNYVNIWYNIVSGRCLLYIIPRSLSDFESSCEMRGVIVVVVVVGGPADICDIMNDRGGCDRGRKIMQTKTVKNSKQRERKKGKNDKRKEKNNIKIPLPRANDKCVNDGVYGSSVTEQGFPSGGFFFAVKVSASAYCRIIIQLYTSGGWPRALMWFAATVDPRPVIRVDGERFLRQHKNSTSKKPIAPVGRLPAAGSASTTATVVADRLGAVERTRNLTRRIK